MPDFVSSFYMIHLKQCKKESVHPHFNHHLIQRIKTHLQNRPKVLTKAKVRILLSEVAQAFEKPIQPKTHHDFSHQKTRTTRGCCFSWLHEIPVGFLKKKQASHLGRGMSSFYEPQLIVKGRFVFVAHFGGSCYI